MNRRLIVFIIVVLALTCGLTVPTYAGTPDDDYKPERYYISNAAQQTTTLDAYDDNTNNALTLTFTPPTDKDFIVIASALTNYETIDNSTIVRLALGPTVSPTGYSETYHQPRDILLNWRGFGTHKILEATGGISYTAKIQYHAEVAGETAYIKRCAIAVLEVFNYENAESNGESTLTTSDYATGNKLTLGFTPGTEADYIIFATANMKNGTSGKGTLSELTLNTVQDAEVEVVDTNYASYAYMEKETLSAALKTFDINYKSEGTSTAYIKDARITAVLADDFGDFYYAETEAEGDGTDLDYYDNDTNNKVTLTTDSLTIRNDYIVIGQGLGRQENVGKAFYANLDIDTTSYGEYVFESGDRALYRSFFILTKVNLTIGSAHTVKIQYKTDTAGGSATAFVKNANIIAIKANTVESYSTRRAYCHR
ncbi:MAG: hypothetical protein ABH839_01725 [Chloroflexota bacterium]